MSKLLNDFKHNKSLNVAVQGLVFMAHALYMLYDWRFAANQFVLASSYLKLTARENFFN
jgi:hypothetical protein